MFNYHNVVFTFIFEFKHTNTPIFLYESKKTLHFLTEFFMKGYFWLKKGNHATVNLLLYDKKTLRRKSAGRTLVRIHTYEFWIVCLWVVLLVRASTLIVHIVCSPDLAICPFWKKYSCKWFVTFSLTRMCLTLLRGVKCEWVKCRF